MAVLQGQIQTQRRQIDVLAGQMSVLLRDRERFAKLVQADAIPRKQLDDIEGQNEILTKQQGRGTQPDRHSPETDRCPASHS
ncbi:MAG: hypothetical protein R2787_17535 [Saprospiraceae bacterium]